MKLGLFWEAKEEKENWGCEATGTQAVTQAATANSNPLIDLATEGRPGRTAVAPALPILNARRNVMSRYDFFESYPNQM